MTVEAATPPAAPPATEYDIRLIGLTKRFDDVVAVDGISLEIDRGHFFALLGPSGCGKTTTLRMIGGFEEPSEGRIELDPPVSCSRPATAPTTAARRRTGAATSARPGQRCST